MEIKKITCPVCGFGQRVSADAKECKCVKCKVAIHLGKPARRPPVGGVAPVAVEGELETGGETDSEDPGMDLKYPWG